jgi:hypothetical protein
LIGSITAKRAERSRANISDNDETAITGLR